jgi:hypothetical protein
MLSKAIYNSSNIILSILHLSRVFLSILTLTVKGMLFIVQVLMYCTTYFGKRGINNYLFLVCYV